MKRKHGILRTLLPAILLLPLLLLALLQTPAGQTALTRSLSRLLSRADDTEVRIGTLSGWIPGAIHISRLELGDADGIWLSAQELHCRWKLTELLQKRIHLPQLSAREIELHRRPAPGAKKNGPKKEATNRPRPSIQLDGLQISRLKLGAAIAGEPLEYAVHSGGMRLTESGALAGSLTVTGDAHGRVELAGRLDDQFTLAADLESLRKPDFGFSQIAGQAQATLSPAGMTGRISASVVKDGQPAHLAAELSFIAQKLRIDPFQLTLREHAVSGKLAVALAPGQIGIDIDALALDPAANRYTLLGQADVTTSNKAWSVDLQTLNIQFNERVAVTLAGTVAPEKLQLSGTVAPFSLTELPVPALAGFSGRAAGQLALSGTLQAPQMQTTLELTQFAGAQGALNELPPLDFHLSATLAKGTLTGSASMTNLFRSSIAAKGTMPCDLSLAPFRFAPQRDQLQAQLAATLDLATFNGLSMLQNQRVAGLLTADLTYREKTPAGFARLSHGHYEHFDTGIVLQEISVDLNATPAGWTLQKATAAAGKAGTLALTGDVSGANLNLQATLNNAKILQRAEAEAQVSGGLKIAGPPSRPNVTGNLIINRAEILLDNLPPPLPKQLTNYDRDAPASAATAARKQRALPLDLDIEIDMPDQIFVNASLIDSTWGGQLRVRNQPAGLSIKGQITPRRGYINFIGKKFRFQSGEIRLGGDVPPSAVINNLTAEYTRNDVTARLIVSGQANDPQIELESSPSMPQDEIISLVLFNRDTRSITPYQAFQIASAAKQLSGGLKGPGLMYQIRRAAGVDTLDWREAGADGEASSVAAGKYVTSELYVEVNRELDAEGQTELTAEYEISRHFSIETSAGPNLQPGIGLNWKTDY